jgi:undecaprenyl diphosphate synthase
MSSKTSNPVRERAASLGVDLERLPRHVAIIMDGNGRWAQGKGLNRLKGHRQGYLSLKDILLQADQLGIECLTVYGFSAENWSRPEAEVTGLMKLINEAAKTELQLLVKENVKVLISGRKEELPDFLRQTLTGLEASTRKNTGIKFVLAINYGGRAEIVDAAKRLAEAGSEITEESIAASLYHPDLPEPDLMIRTAGEMRWSNFLIWQAAYAELVVTDVTWPEFGGDELIDAVRTYQSRDRKFGGLPGSS